MSGDIIHIIGGGTFAPVRNHLALCAPAFGATARRIEEILRVARHDYRVEATLTAMAGGRGDMRTNADVADLVDHLVADPKTRAIVLNAALCDYEGSVGGVEGDFHGERLKTADGPVLMELTPAAKILGRIRRDRKDIFAVAFKTTTGATPDEQYAVALRMLKANSLNLVLANDTVTRHNMIVAPEETRYCETTDRERVLRELCTIMLSRLRNTFTRSTVVEGGSIAWSDPLIPDNLRAVVDHCIARGAYKPIDGRTAGHFAVRIDDRTILTSKRKQDFNRLPEIGLVRVEYDGTDRVVAHGAKPSVGGQSQRIVFAEHGDLDCIVHAHVPLRHDAPDAALIGGAEQWRNECGSTQCGRATSRNLRPVGGGIHAVMLEGHGPNVVFGRDVPAADVVAFIERNFDLTAKTGGFVPA